jgi:hypothetical protein
MKVYNTTYAIQHKEMQKSEVNKSINAKHKLN